MNKACTTSNCG